MKNIINVHIYKGENYYLAECSELHIVTQAKSLDELIENKYRKRGVENQ